MLNEKESKREKIRKKMCAEFAIIDNIYLKYSSCMRYQDARPISKKKNDSRREENIEYR